MTLTRRGLAAGIAVVGLALSPALAGCGQAAEQVAEQAAEQAIGGGDVNIEDDGVTVTDDEGNQMAIGDDVQLPDNWPADVPVYDGGTLSLVSVGADGTVNAMWTVDGTPEEAIDTYGAALESAGFTSDSETNMGDMFIREYTGNGYRVNASTVEAEGSTSLIVTAEKG